MCLIFVVVVVLFIRGKGWWWVWWGCPKAELTAFAFVGTFTGFGSNLV